MSDDKDDLITYNVSIVGFGIETFSGHSPITFPTFKFDSYNKAVSFINSIGEALKLAQMNDYAFSATITSSRVFNDITGTQNNAND